MLKKTLPGVSSPSPMQWILLKKPIFPSPLYTVPLHNPSKTFTENWDSTRHLVDFSWLIYRLRSKLYFFRNKTFLFFKIESWNFQHAVWNSISWNLTKFQLIQLIQTIFISIFSIPCLIELKFWEISRICFFNIC